MNSTQKVHKIKISRRRNYAIKHNYKEYRDILTEDFHGQCGYCGKKQTLLYDIFHIDHFAPKSIFKEKENDYTNLVLACPVCNRNKSNKWISDKVEIPHNDDEGFVDPASDEFDLHLARDNKGRIAPLSNVGYYMIRELKFDIRPTSLMYKLDILLDKKEELGSIDSNAAKDLYIKIDKFINESREILKYKHNE